MNQRNGTETHDLSLGLSIIGGIGLGAGLMYLLDPDRGRRRRALLRDQAAHANRALNHAAGKTSRDVRHRAYGLWAKTSRLFKHDDVTEQALEARVRSNLGRAVSHPHAIQLIVLDGKVTLKGHVLADELNALRSRVAKTPGVREVHDDQLAVHAEAGDEPTLQGGRPTSFALAPASWTPAARLLAGAAGGALMGYCLKRRGAAGASFGAMGFGLAVRALANQEVKGLVGVGRDCPAVEVQKTIKIHAPIGQVFDFWNDYRNFPRFMSNVRRVDANGDGQSHWTVTGPAGVPIEWTAEVTESIPNRLLAWRTVPGSAIENEGTVHFEPVNGSTRVHIRMCYRPPGGVVGHAVAKFFGADPKSEMDADLVRMKTLIETGHAPRDAARPWSADREVALTHNGAA